MTNDKGFQNLPKDSDQKPQTQNAAANNSADEKPSPERMQDGTNDFANGDQEPHSEQSSKK